MKSFKEIWGSTDEYKRLEQYLAQLVNYNAKLSCKDISSFLKLYSSNLPQVDHIKQIESMKERKQKLT